MASQYGAMNKAIEYVRQLVSEVEKSNHNRLPPLRSMASKAGVSYRTMWKAVSVLEKEGIVECIQGQGISIGKVSKRDDSRSVEEQWGEKLWHTKEGYVQTQIRRDIINDVFHRGSELPSSKELTARYGTCTKTLSSALKALVEDNTIYPYKRSYIIPQLTPSSSFSTLIFIGAMGNPNLKRLEVTRPVEQEFIRVLDHERAKANIYLKRVIFKRDESPIQLYNEGGAPFHISQVSGSVIGCFLWSISLEQQFLDYINLLKTWQCPVAVFNEGHIDPFPQLTFPSHKAFFMSTGENAARKIGDFLLRRGHRKIAYISPFHASVSQSRLRGLQDSFRRAGFASGVVPFISLEYPHEWALLESQKERRSRPAAPRHLSQPEKLVYPYSRLSMHLEMEREIAACIEPFVARQFETALKDPQITAWVCYDDRIALFALDYLNYFKIPVPEKISLIGLDDTLEGLRRNLSSYNFNVHAVVNAMLDHVLRPPSPKRARPNEVVEIGGMVMDRTTVAATG
jgi:DNA-binding GntR family transcriptional regulator/DNA-binding LacI/PurR family transcriptional regulator